MFVFLLWRQDEGFIVCLHWGGGGELDAKIQLVEHGTFERERECVCVTVCIHV